MASFLDDRRSHLTAYRGLHFLAIRQLKNASDLFIDALSTFTATELISYNDFVALAVISVVLALKRPDVKKRVGEESGLDFSPRAG